MVNKSRFFDDIAGVAGGVISAAVGVREEINAMVQSRVDEVLTRLQVVRREEFEALRELATRARLGQEEAEKRLAALEQRLSTLEKTHQTVSDT